MMSRSSTRCVAHPPGSTGRCDGFRHRATTPIPTTATTKRAIVGIGGERIDATSSGPAPITAATKNNRDARCSPSHSETVPKHPKRTSTSRPRDADRRAAVSTIRLKVARGAEATGQPVRKRVALLSIEPPAIIQILKESRSVLISQAGRPRHQGPSVMVAPASRRHGATPGMRIH